MGSLPQEADRGEPPGFTAAEGEPRGTSLSSEHPSCPGDTEGPPSSWMLQLTLQHLDFLWNSSPPSLYINYIISRSFNILVKLLITEYGISDWLEYML